MIQQLAEQMEDHFFQNFPTIHGQWNASGRLPL